MSRKCVSAENKKIEEVPKAPNYLARRIGAAVVAALVGLGLIKGGELAADAVRWAEDQHTVGCTTTSIAPGEPTIDAVDRAIASIGAPASEDPAWRRETLEAAVKVGPTQPGDTLKVCVETDNIFGNYVKVSRP